MQSVRILATASSDLAAAFEILRKRMKLKHLSELLIALVRRAAITGLKGRERTLIQDLAGLSLAERDILDAQILAALRERQDVAPNVIKLPNQRAA